MFVPIHTRVPRLIFACAPHTLSLCAIKVKLSAAQKLAVKRQRRKLRKVNVVRKSKRSVAVYVGPRKSKKVCAASSPHASVSRHHPPHCSQEMRPFLLATLRRPVCMMGSGGFATRKVLLDTGARRSAITSEVCAILKLKPHGERQIKIGNGNAPRTLMYSNTPWHAH
jgi:hypothetical protein